jgi:hypothetical protein
MQVVLVAQEDDLTLVGRRDGPGGRAVQRSRAAESEAVATHSEKARRDSCLLFVS